MLERLLEQRVAVSVHNSESDIVNLNENQWNLLKGMISLLQPFEEITKIISHSHCSISEVIPNIATLLRYLQKDNPLHFGVGTMKQELKASVKTL